MHHWIQSVILHLILRPLPKQPPFFEGEFRWTSNVAGRCRFSVWTVIKLPFDALFQFGLNHTWTKLDKIKPILSLFYGTFLILPLLNGTFFYVLPPYKWDILISTPFKWDNFRAKNKAFKDRAQWLIWIFALKTTLWFFTKNSRFWHLKMTRKITFWFKYNF